jgi:hypothetical protein
MKNNLPKESIQAFYKAFRYTNLMVENEFILYSFKNKEQAIQVGAEAKELIEKLELPLIVKQDFNSPLFSKVITIEYYEK